MVLSCSCDDFDLFEHESWLEPGDRTIPPKDETCCECNAVLSQTEHEGIDYMEVFHPEGVPQAPWDADGDPDITDEEYEAIDKTFDEFCDANGYDGDYERFVRVVATVYRCERCADLASAFTDLDYCWIVPGQLIYAHVEYAELQGRLMKWVADSNGVLQPTDWIWFDHIKDYIGTRYRRTRNWLRWGWKGSFRRKIYYPLKRRFAKLYRGGAI